MRLLLALTLIHGMVPAFGEVAEAAVHYVVAGHLAHTSADHGDLGDQGEEHGCCPTDHHCACCSAQPVLAAQPDASIPGLHLSAGPIGTWAQRRVTRSPEPPFRPPIV